MRADDLSRMDLNLLFVFEAVMQERSVTRAAQRLNVQIDVAVGEEARVFSFKLEHLTLETVASPGAASPTRGRDSIVEIDTSPHWEADLGRSHTHAHAHIPPPPIYISPLRRA